MFRNLGIQITAGLNDLLEQGIAAVLDVAQIRGGLRPGQVAQEGVPQIQAEQAGTHKGEVVNTQGTGVKNNPGLGARGAARAPGGGAVK